MDTKKKILVADDDRFVREMLRVMLTREGYDLVFAEDGVQAIEIAASENPDLVLTDGLLPKMHGFVVCKTLKATAKPPKVVLLTAIYTKPTYRWEVKKEYGADDILSKPVKSDALIACLRKHLVDDREREAASSEPVPSYAGSAAVKAQVATGGAEFAAGKVGRDNVPCEADGSSSLTGFNVLPAA
ncbi:MAG TPA: response regulator [Blastocatellia bacterium]|nr:response regulator [Blastocatellia bacterium]